MQTIKSKFRTGYLGQKIFLFCFLLGLTVIFVNLAVSNEKFTFDNKKIWGVLILIVFLLYGIYSLCINKELQALTINEKIIISKNIITKQKTVIPLNQIKRFSAKVNTFRSRDGVLNSDGLLIMQIELKNGNLFHINENDYENFHEIKRFIYDHVMI